VGTERGAELLKAHGVAGRPAVPADFDAREAHYRKKQEMQKARIHSDAADLPLLFEGALKDPVWEKVAERCLGCGTCTQVCPTCYCFDVEDDVNALAGRGERARTWDSCQLRAFTEVAGGEIFREKLSRRLRHRVYRKFHYLHTRFNEPNCTGCGRCGRQCVAGIRMDEVVNDLLASMVGVRMGGGRR
jgi:sulfhydrogenase subunit beta (sulfur reductase)